MWLEGPAARVDGAPESRRRPVELAAQAGIKPHGIAKREYNAGIGPASLCAMAPVYPGVMPAGAKCQQAIVQPTPWEHILDLQQMQSQDLIDVIREKQRQSAAGRLELD